MAPDDEIIEMAEATTIVGWVLAAIVAGLIALLAVGFAGGWYARKHTAADRVQVATAQLQAAMAHNEEASAIAAEALVTAAAYEIETNLRKIYCDEGKKRKGK